MKKQIAATLIAAAALGLAACGQGASNNPIVNEEVVSNGAFPADLNDTLSNGEVLNETVVPANVTAN